MKLAGLLIQPEKTEVKKNFKLSLDPEILERLEAYCSATSRPPEQIVAGAIKFFLTKGDVEFARYWKEKNKTGSKG